MSARERRLGNESSGMQDRKCRLGNEGADTGSGVEESKRNDIVITACHRIILPLEDRNKLCI